MGGLRHFRRENAPEGAPLRCTDGCPASETCPFFAPKIYLENYPIREAVSKAANPFLRALGKVSLKNSQLIKLSGKIIPPLRVFSEYSGWPRTTITAHPESNGAVMDALRDGPYGRCVYHCDNNVVDHQVVNMTFESGITATLTMHGHCYEGGRTLRVDGSRATLLGKFTYSQAWLEIYRHAQPGVERFTFPTEVNQSTGHGGGDAGVMQSFVQAMRGEQAPLTTAHDSLESHLMAFAAEASRVADKTVDMAQFRKAFSLSEE
jgi:hypothetical protein